jgi:superfamily II DNA or RNA helicase
MAPPALTRGDIVRIRDERWSVAESSAYAETTIVTVVGCDRANRGIRARYLLPFEPIERLPSIDTTRIVSRRRWAQLARQTIAQATPSIASLRTPAGAGITILPYQLEPALAVAGGSAARILIADDVGLGKTIQAGLIVAEVLARGASARVLIVCPAALREQWRAELAERFHLTPAVLDAASLEGAAPGVNPWSAFPLVLASIDYIKRPEVIRALEPLVWDLMVVDEAHGVARPSDRHTAAALLAQRARTVVLLTATPHSGDDASFDRLTAIGDVEGSFPLLVFRRKRTAIEGAVARHTRWLNVRPTDVERQMHQALIAYVRRVLRNPATPAGALAMIVLTRRACSSARSLERSLERRLALLSGHPGVDGQLPLPLNPAAPDDEEAGVEMGSPGLEDPRDERDALERLLALARRAADAESKLRAVARLLRRSGESAIVFTEYRDTLSTLERELGHLGTCQLHGGLTAAERACVLREFTAGRRRILLATDAASEGLNLHHRCRLVVHLEVPWTPTRIEQRIGRVDRIGQSRTVHQMLLVSAGTVEESRVSDIVRRTLQAASALDDLSTTPVDERTVAAHVFDNVPLSRAPVVPAPTLSTPGTELQTLAAAEAARLLIVRQLMGRSSSERDFRAFAARSHKQKAPAVGALWVEVADSAGQLLWETLAGVTAEWRSSDAVSAAETRTLVHLWWERVRGHVANDAALARVLSLDSIRTVASLALKREAALADGIVRRRARLAASLVQGGLFDRRAERDALFRRELLDHALSRFGERKAALERLNRTRVAIRPAFVLIPW